MRKFEGFQKGVNLGGWISQFRKYDKAHFDSYITEEDIRNIKEFGFDHVRCPVDYIVLEDEVGNVREDGFSYLEMCRQWCEKYGLNMIIDLHECYGYSFDPMKKDDKKQFFYNEKDQERFLKLWEQIAVRFAKYSSSVAFEPLNEVVMYEVADAWNKLLCKYVERMRALAPDTYLVIGVVCYNSVRTLLISLSTIISYITSTATSLWYLHIRVRTGLTICPQISVSDIPRHLKSIRRHQRSFPRILPARSSKTA